MPADPQTNKPDPSAAPPNPIRRNARKPLTLAFCGTILAGLLLIVVMSLDRGQPVGPKDQSPREVTELLVPPPLTEADMAGGGTSFDEAIGDLPAGGWIQIAGDDGALAQQYRFERLDPDPPGMGPGWIHLTDPEFEIYGKGGSVVTLSGDSAMAYAPNRAIESGTLTGNVRILRYETAPTGAGNAPLDPPRDKPALAVFTDAARFDNILGEVRCDGDIDLETRSGTFSGRRLRLLMNDRDDIIQRLDIEEVGEIRLATATRNGEDAPASSNTDSPTDLASPDDGARADRKTASASAPASGEPAPPEASRAAGTANEPAQWYLLTLHEDVRIVQGSSADQRTVLGDSLTVLFTNESEGLGPSVALRPGAPSRPATGPPPGPSLTAMGPLTRETLLVAAALAAFSDREHSIAPAPHPDDTVITCTGGLTVVPVTRPTDDLDPNSARLELLGNPVRLTDPGAEANATCQALQYHIPAGRLELIGSGDHPLQITSPQLVANADRFWLTDEDRLGGFTGAGTMELIPPVTDETPAGPATRDESAQSMRLTWGRAVDLEFDRAGGTTGGTFLPLRTATFRESVVAEGETFTLIEAAAAPDAVDVTSGRLTCDELAIHFRESGEPPRDGAETISGGGTGVEPDRLVAIGHVAVTDQQQSLWARSLDVRFARGTPGGTDTPDRTPAGGTRNADAAGLGGGLGGGGGRIDVDHLIARDDVHLLLANGQRIFADTLEVDGAARTVVLLGDDVRLVDGGNVIDRARRIWIDEKTGRSTLEGRGRFRRFDGPVFPEDDPDGAGPPRSGLLDHIAGRVEELRVTWRDGVEIDPGDETTPGEARFDGDVTVLTSELRLTHADRMVIRFSGDQLDEGNGIQSIEATGDVIARSVGDDGELRCAKLTVEIESDENGASLPRLLTATGGVSLAQQGQRMWTDTLAATFRPVADDVAPEPVDTTFGAARVRLGKLRATGGVQLLGPKGERAFADRLEADGIHETAELRDHVLIVSDDFILDRAEHLIVDQSSSEYRVLGPGEFYVLAEALVLDAVNRIDRPTPMGDRTIEASWRNGAVYTLAADGSGELELRGAVHAKSRPNPLEFNTIDAELLRLSFLERAPDTADADPATALARLLARGGAKLESRTWSPEDPDGKPQVFYVSGEEIDYDQVTLEARVTGAGELLIRNEDEAGLGPSAAENRGFARKGTTLLRWADRLHMTRQVDDRFTIVMTGDVTCIHRDLAGRASTLTGQHLEADIVRMGVSVGDEAGSSATQVASGLDFGGAIDPKRLYGRGGLAIHTPERDVSCDEFDYNLTTGFAEVNADPGRMVYVRTNGAAEPMRHERVLWNMNDDTITIFRGGIAGSP